MSAVVSSKQKVNIGKLRGTLRELENELGVTIEIEPVR